MALTEREREKAANELEQYICDKLCKYTEQVEDQDDLIDICSECEVGCYMQKILNV